MVSSLNPHDAQRHRDFERRTPMDEQTTRARRNGDISYWFTDTEQTPPRAPLDRNRSADIVLVGAGFTNLWAAYYLKKQAPALDIVILEREVAGFGASSRNGGWVSYGLPGLASRYARTHGGDAVARFQREIFGTIDEIVRVAEAEGIDADIEKDGEIAIATNPAQVGRLRDELASASRWGFTADDLKWIDRDELGSFANLDGALGGLWSPHCARVQPARLARGLARVVEGLGVRIYENTAVHEIRPHAAITTDGLEVTANYVVRGTEGYSPSVKGQRRDWLPKLSSMIVTEPLTAAQLETIGWSSSVLVRDAAHSFFYIQKTRDGRIALGGSGVPYLYGSKVDDSGISLPRTERALIRGLHQLFPSTKGIGIDHTWTGVLGIPRDWSATVSIDHESGIGVAGGYVGDGVSASNLAGRTMRDLILGNDSDLLSMPWVNKRIRRWEPEPLRWIAVTGLYEVYSAADRLEHRFRSGRTSVLATFANAITGRH